MSSAVRTTRNISRASAYRRNKNDFVAVFQGVIGLDVVLVDGVEQPGLDRRELWILFFQRAPEVGDRAAVAQFFCDLGGADTLSKDGEEFHRHFHCPLSCPPMC